MNRMNSAAFTVLAALGASGCEEPDSSVKVTFYAPPTNSARPAEWGDETHTVSLDKCDVGGPTDQCPEDLVCMSAAEVFQILSQCEIGARFSVSERTVGGHRVGDRTVDEICGSDFGGASHVRDGKYSESYADLCAPIDCHGWDSEPRDLCPEE